MTSTMKIPTTGPITETDLEYLNKHLSHQPYPWWIYILSAEEKQFFYSERVGIQFEKTQRPYLTEAEAKKGRPR